MTAQEFIEWELDRPGRHEFFRGEVIKVFGEDGARREHVTVMGNIGVALNDHLRGTANRIFVAQMRVHVRATGVGGAERLFSIQTGTRASQIIIKALKIREYSISPLGSWVLGTMPRTLPPPR